jgi:hypothetical protein
VPLFAAASLILLKSLTTTVLAMEAVKPGRSDRVRGAIYGAISADALCLGKATGMRTASKLPLVVGL